MGQKKSKLFDEEKVMRDYRTLTYEQIQYISRQTNLIDKEVLRRHEQFLNMAKDGRMTKEELTSVLQKIWSKGKVEKFADYLFNYCDQDQQGFIGFPEFIVLHCQLKNDKSYLGFLFDMIDTRQKGYLSRDKIEVLFAALFELIGLPDDDDDNRTHISQSQIAHLIEIVDASEEKRLSRNQFMNIRNKGWIDQSNGVGTLLIEHSC